MDWYILLSHAMSDSSQHLRLALTVTHLLLVALGSVNLIVILLIITRPYLRSITNVYMIGLCLADFIYLADLILVAATSLNGKSWPFGPTICHLFHGTEATGKYASVLFVVLLAADRYIAMCKSDLCGRYRTYRTAIFLSGLAWIAALICSLPLYVYADEIKVRMRPKNGTDAIENNHTLCIAHWPSPPHAQWSPFWLFNLFSAIFRVRITTQLMRIVVNIIHLFPYVNCALNPVLYAYRAENFRTAFKSLLFWSRRSVSSKLNQPLPMPEDARSTSASTYYRNSSNLDGLKLQHTIKSPMEATSVYLPEEESPVDSNEKLEMERKKAELQAWRPYDGTNCEVLEVQYDHHKCSARSILLPAVTMDEGTKL
uniref:G_PROTEIN_RECEP_F1_2 domain-containing protein n=1 Tax=Caenorhabditis japonica TaxID=281687 RepID=A0A8R1HH56_CAEJA